MIPLLAPLMIALLQAPAPVAYRFEQVKRSVYLSPGGDQAREAKAVVGAPAAAGDLVRTGWLGQAVIEAPASATRFEIFANTRVRLAGQEPGVLLVLERGRVKGFFRALLEGRSEERRIAVPGALLAVRGTRYGVEVDGQGRSTLAVFEGVVEILRTGAAGDPVRVRAGEWSAFGPAGPTRVEPAGSRGFGERAWGQGMRPDGSMTPRSMPGGAMTPGSGSSGGMHGTSGHMH
jgi:hypothetical protein